MNDEPGNKIPELEKVCESCGGKRKEYDHIEDCFADCCDCNGSGFVPTPIGSRILDLIRHNSRVTVSAELRVSGAAS